MKVLNVGGGGSREIPYIYSGYEQDLLDIDASVKPDIVCDAKEMRKLKQGQYDAVFCSHNLEHFYKRDVPTVLAGFMHVLKKDGFANIVVPDMQNLFDCLVKGNMDIDDTWYMAGRNPISFHDVMYGWGAMMGRGNLYYAHKCGFTERSITKALRAAGFKKIMTATDNGNLHAFAFKDKPSADKLRRLGL